MATDASRKQDKQAPAAPARKTKLAARALPFIKSDSALLPEDKWVIATVKDLLRSNRNLQRNVASAGGLALAALGGIAAVGFFAATTTLALAPALAIGAAGLAATAGLVTLGALATVRHFKAHTAPELMEEIKQRYTKMKSDELKAAWNARRLAAQQAKAEKAAQAPKVETGAQAPKVETAAPAKEGASLAGLFKSLRAKQATPANDKPADAAKTAAPKTPRP